ncbi:MAG: sigma-70 family RNA polymerase sigma factor [Sedimentisphaerales bacterium]|nr:sigma-70 family RNA polymerase sigma factor [Sedimentisphaerales bacterium]
MRKISNPHIAQLLMQLRFTSVAKRKQFLNHTENLIYIVEPQKEYPFDFICFKITGYHPKGLPQELIKGEELAADLRIFLWKLSGQVEDEVEGKGENIYPVDKLADLLKVSVRTISRWRENGLLARKYTFNDGTRRLAVSQSSLDKYLQKNPALAGNRRSVERLTPQEKKTIISEARKLAPKAKHRQGVIDKITKKVGRSREAVRKILSEYEDEHPKRKLFKSHIKPLEAGDSAEIFRLHKQGVPIEDLMENFNRSKSYIYRVIRRKKAKSLLNREIEYIHSDEFEKPDAETEILNMPLSRMKTGEIKERKIDLQGGSITKYLQSLKNITRLTRQKETELFRKYNFLKYLAASSQEQLHKNKSSAKNIRTIEKCLTQAEAIKNNIIELNQHLVVSIASKHKTHKVPLQDLISEGNFLLMRAVEGFDYTRGFRFTTYASWVIAKNFARTIPAKTKLSGKTTAGLLEDVQRDFRLEEAIDFGAIERARHSLVQVIKEELDEREQYVILHHYGLTGSAIIKKTKTLQQIGNELELTGERVRQIELQALQKLKQSLSIEEFELLTE